MPLEDRTGPLGLGPMTGRGLGYCAGYGTPGYANPIGYWWRGFGFGRGFGRGYGYGRFLALYPYYGIPYRAPYGLSVKDEKAILTEQAKAIENELKAIKERLTELERQSQNEEK